MSAKEQFASKVSSLIQQARQLSPAARKNVMDLLNEARKQVIAEVAGVDPQSFHATQLKMMARSIDRAMAQFGDQLTAKVNADQKDAFNLGEATVGAPLDAAGLNVPVYGGVSAHALAIAQGYTADLIAGLAKDSAAKLNAAIQRAFLGGQSMTDIIEQIGKALAGDEGFSGLFSPIGARAQMIATNEILRVHSIAAQAKLEDLAQSQPALQKQWIHVPAAKVPRLGHIMASGQVQDVDKPFDIEGEDLMYPRDPNGSPENTINCHCLVTPYFDASALAPSEAQKQIQELGYLNQRESRLTSFQRSVYAGKSTSTRNRLA